MSGRNRHHPPPHHYGTRGLGPPPTPHVLDDIRFGPPPSSHLAVIDELRFGHPPPPQAHHSAVIEERAAAQLHDVQAMLVDNQRLAATHVALKQELAAVHHEIQLAAHALSANANPENDIPFREVYEKFMKLEMELRAVEETRSELIQVRGDIQKLNASRQELLAQIQALRQDLARAMADSQQTQAMKAEIENLKQEIQRSKSAIEFEKKGYSDNYEQGQVMEKNLITMAREVEKLRAEISNAEKRARAAAAAGNQGSTAAAYGGNYANADPSYAGNLYPGYFSNPVLGGVTENALQYGSGPAQGSWVAYDPQRAHGLR